MGVPAHDSRDFQFAIENSIAIKPVFEPAEGEVLPYPGSGPLVNSGEFSGLSSADAIDAITAAAAKEGWGKAHTMYNLRDWLVSRQRYASTVSTPSKSLC
jgi:leucyl-tRNA synthetase